MIDLKNLKESKIILVGGMDRSGTTKIGSLISKQLDAYLIPEIFPVSLCVLNYPENYYNEVKKFLKSYRGKEIDQQLKTILLNLELNSSDRILKFWDKIQKGIGKRIVETSPINLEITAGINDNNISFIYLYRDIKDIWSSHKKIFWGPSTPFDMIRDFERRLTLLNSLKNKNNTIVLKYNLIYDFEKLLGWKEDSSNFSDLPSFTKEQHLNIDKKFKSVSYNIPSYEEYVFDKSSFVNLELSNLNIYQKFFYEIIIFLTSIKRIFNLRFSSFFRKRNK
ncbi:hypothetical protein HOK00_09095 [bacterium]|nr:hypothetical protein [bacterium]